MAHMLSGRSWGMIVLGIWLILTGISPFLGMAIPYPVLPVLAIAAGVLIIAGR